jgi:hypothetical protein
VLKFHKCRLHSYQLLKDCSILAWSKHLVHLDILALKIQFRVLLHERANAHLSRKMGWDWYQTFPADRSYSHVWHTPVITQHVLCFSHAPLPCKLGFQYIAVCYTMTLVSFCFVIELSWLYGTSLGFSNH